MVKPLIDEALAILDELDKKRSPGPWNLTFDANWHGDEYVMSSPSDICMMTDTPYYPIAPKHDDARFIAALANYWPILREALRNG